MYWVMGMLQQERDLKDKVGGWDVRVWERMGHFQLRKWLRCYSWNWGRGM